METLKTKVSFGKFDSNGTGKRINEIVVSLELKDHNGKPEFTTCATVWNIHKTDSIMGGQCLDTIAERLPELKNNPKYNTILDLWKKYHLNSMNAGTREQSAAIEEEAQRQGVKWLEYTKACDYLKSINLYEVEHEGKPYKYGHDWIYYAIPSDDLQKIENLIKGTESCLQ
jgi:hypothetical protein